MNLKYMNVLFCCSGGSLKGDFCVKKIEVRDTAQGITLDEGSTKYTIKY